MEMSFYTGNKFIYFLINFSLFGPLIITTVILLFWKRKKQCIAGGFLYLIGGLIVWLLKVGYYIYLILSSGLSEHYKETFSNSFYIVSFLISIIVLFFRLGAAYFTKAMYADVCLLEVYIHEKEHAELIQSLATQNEDEKIINDDEIGNKKNPFRSGREKKEDDEEIEFNIGT